MRVTAVIPGYNEASRIAATIAGVRPYVDEIIVVDDASADGTAQVAEKAGAKVFCQPENQGYIAAIKRGFLEAAGEIVVTIDADGEFPAENIPELVAPLLEGHADMVQGRRNLVPRPSEQVLTFLANFKAPVGDTGTGFRALRTALARRLELKGVCVCGVFSLEIVVKGGRITEIPIVLRSVDKPRKIAWYHIKQFFYLLPWLFRKY